MRGQAQCYVVHAVHRDERGWSELVSQADVRIKGADQGAQEPALACPGMTRVLVSAPHCRALREELYRAYITRASSGPSDNTPLMERTLTLRAEQARLLGYANYAEVSLARKVGGQFLFWQIS